jgi:hypothetical protein
MGKTSPSITHEDELWGDFSTRLITSKGEGGRIWCNFSSTFSVIINEWARDEDDFRRDASALDRLFLKSRS